MDWKFSILLLVFYYSSVAINVAWSQAFDAFGGYTKIKGQKTGQWHVEEIDGRHWFVTPEGNAMYVLGINHIQVRSDSERKAAVEHLGKWHFNSGGYGIPEWMLDDYPGFIHVTLHHAVHWLPAHRFAFYDVFSVDFEENVEAIIREKCEIGKDNPNVIGYSLTDTPRYTLDIIRRRRGIDWVSYIRELPAESAGKQRYVQFLRDTYDNNFEKFQVDYRLEDIDSFEDLLDYDYRYLELRRPAIRRDDETFVALIAEKIYQLTEKYFDKYHPNALLLSEKFKIHDHPPEILKLAGKYFDVISIQPGPTKGPDVGQGPDESTFDPAYWKKLHELTGKPVFITDHGFAFYTSEHT